jgi:hypothetical protein
MKRGLLETANKVPKTYIASTGWSCLLFVAAPREQRIAAKRTNSKHGIVSGVSDNSSLIDIKERFLTKCSKVEAGSDGEI